MVPLLGSGENPRHIQTVCTATVPAYGECTVTVVVEKELAPTGTYLMSIVGILVVAHPELYGCLSQHF